MCVPLFNPHICRWIVAVVQSLSHVRLCVTPSTAARQASLSFTISLSLLKLMYIAIQPSHPLSSASTLAPNLSQHKGLFQWVDSSCHLVKGLELQLQQQSFQRIFRVLPVELTGLISLGSPRDSQESSPALQLLKASVLWCFAFFVVQLSYPYVTPGKNKALGDLCWQSDVSAF